MCLCGLWSNAAFGQTVWDWSLYAEQAARGQAAYSQYCSRCHKADLLGIEGAMKGEPFMERRREDNLETLFLDMKATMPRGNPGGLPDQTYTDIISYLLQNNDMPTGTDELKPSALEKVQLVGKDGPNLSPILRRYSRSAASFKPAQNSWTLVQASEPVRTRDSFKKIEKELSGFTKRGLSANTHSGCKMPRISNRSLTSTRKCKSKACIVRSPDGTRINVNSIEGVSENCHSSRNTKT